MDGFIEKFNIFDLFTMLIPGVIICTLLGISLSSKYYYTWNNCGIEKYTIFFILSYFCGIIMQQIGNIIDEKVLYKLIYGGYPKQVFLSQDNLRKFFNNEFFYNEVMKIKEKLIDDLTINMEIINTEEQRLQLNEFLFLYCLNIVENNHLTYKSDKMLVISEMNRSLSFGCLLVCILNLVLCFLINGFSLYKNFFIIESSILVILFFIFFYCKIQFEKYRYKEIFQSFLVYYIQ